MRALVLDGGTVSVQFRRRTLLTEGDTVAQGEYLTWQIAFHAPIAVNELARAVAQLCAIYDPELGQHIVSLLTCVAALPDKPLDPTVPPQGTLMN
jgi:hypothetical protein